jgi:hypothetical protein
VKGKELHGTLGFALRLRVAVPEYECLGLRKYYKGF